MKANSDFLERVRRVRDKIAVQYLDSPGVSLIDIGYALKDGLRSNQIVVRVHVRKKWMVAGKHKQVRFPDQVDGIPVIIVPGNYQFRNNTSNSADESHK